MPGVKGHHTPALFIVAIVLLIIGFPSLVTSEIRCGWDAPSTKSHVDGKSESVHAKSVVCEEASGRKDANTTLRWTGRFHYRGDTMRTLMGVQRQPGTAKDRYVRVELEHSIVSPGSGGVKLDSVDGLTARIPFREELQALTMATGANRCGAACYVRELLIAELLEWYKTNGGDSDVGGAKESLELNIVGISWLQPQPTDDGQSAPHHDDFVRDLAAGGRNDGAGEALKVVKETTYLRFFYHRSAAGAAAYTYHMHRGKQIGHAKVTSATLGTAVITHGGMGKAITDANGAGISHSQRTSTSVHVAYLSDYGLTSEHYSESLLAVRAFLHEAISLLEQALPATSNTHAETGIAIAPRPGGEASPAFSRLVDESLSQMFHSRISSGAAPYAIRDYYFSASPQMRMEMLKRVDGRHYRGLGPAAYTSALRAQTEAEQHKLLEPNVIKRQPLIAVFHNDADEGAVVGAVTCMRSTYDTHSPSGSGVIQVHRTATLMPIEVTISTIKVAWKLGRLIVKGRRRFGEHVKTASYLIESLVVGEAYRTESALGTLSSQLLDAILSDLRETLHATPQPDQNTELVDQLRRELHEAALQSGDNESLGVMFTLIPDGSILGHVTKWQIREHAFFRKVRQAENSGHAVAKEHGQMAVADKPGKTELTDVTYLVPQVGQSDDGEGVDDTTRHLVWHCYADAVHEEWPVSSIAGFSDSPDVSQEKVPLVFVGQLDMTIAALKLTQKTVLEKLQEMSVGLYRIPALHSDKTDKDTQQIGYAVYRRPLRYRTLGQRRGKVFELTIWTILEGHRSAYALETLLRGTIDRLYEIVKVARIEAEGGMMSWGRQKELQKAEAKISRDELTTGHTKDEKNADGQDAERSSAAGSVDDEEADEDADPYVGIPIGVFYDHHTSAVEATYHAARGSITKVIPGPDKRYVPTKLEYGTATIADVLERVFGNKDDVGGIRGTLHGTVRYHLIFPAPNTSQAAATEASNDE